MCVGVVIWGLKRAGGNRTGVLRFFVFIFESEKSISSGGSEFCGRRRPRLRNHGLVSGCSG